MNKFKQGHKLTPVLIFFYGLSYTKQASKNREKNKSAALKIPISAASNRVLRDFFHWIALLKIIWILLAAIHLGSKLPSFARSAIKFALIIPILLSMISSDISASEIIEDDGHGDLDLRSKALGSIEDDGHGDLHRDCAGVNDKGEEKKQTDSPLNSKTVETRNASLMRSHL